MCPFLRASLFSIESLGHLQRVLRHSFNCSITRIFLHGLHPPDHSCKSSKSISLKDHRREGEKHTGLEESHEDGEGNNHGSSHNGFRCSLLPRTMTFSSWASWTAHSNSIRNGKSSCFHPFSAIPHPSLLTDRYSRHSAYRSSKNQQPRLLHSLTLSTAVRASSSSSSVWAWQWNQCCRLILFFPLLGNKSNRSAALLRLWFKNGTRQIEPEIMHESTHSSLFSARLIRDLVSPLRHTVNAFSVSSPQNRVSSRIQKQIRCWLFQTDSSAGFFLAVNTRSVAGCSRHRFFCRFSSRIQNEICGWLVWL